METVTQPPNKNTDQVSVTVGARGLQTVVKAGDHTFLMDEPKEIGGTNSGPRPQDLILASLGSCTGITLRMYANHKGWPLEKIDVQLEFEEVAAEAVSEEPKKIKMQVLVHGNLTQDQVERLKVISQKCPIHKALSPAFPISTEVELAAPEFQ